MRKLLWHLNDLRLDDHPVISHVDQNDALLPVYVFDPNTFRSLTFDEMCFAKTGSLRFGFLCQTLTQLREAYRSQGQDLIICLGDPVEIISDLAQQWGADLVLTQVEVTSEECLRQEALRQRLYSLQRVIPLETFAANTLSDLANLPFAIAETPATFTAFRKQIEPELTVPAPQKACKLESLQRLVLCEIMVGKLPDPESLGLSAQTIDGRTAFPFEAGEAAARQHLKQYVWDSQLAASYKQTRNELIGSAFSSKFSPWLATGALTARQIYQELKRFEAEVVANDSTYWLFFELLWRDYFRLVAAQHGNALFHAGGIQGRQRHFENPPGHFKAWTQAQTADPFVNACMRELQLTGYLSNRGRQNAASYLCYDLDVDWRWGAAWFEHCLLDYDPCSNWGNWGYIAGVGNGGPSRRFDVLKQAALYDPQQAYQQRWSTV